MLDNVIKTLAQVFRRQPVVFFGAGVSLNSGIPIVHGGEDYEGLVDNILRNLSATEEDIQAVVDRGMPFEAFIEDLTIGSSIDLLLEVFDADVPNHAHKFFAQCALKGLASTFVTTNFDQLLEKALEDAGEPFQVFSSDTAFSQIDWESEKTRVIKLHGSIDQKDDLGVILKRVAQKRFSKEFREVLSHVFAENDERHVVIFGYSCSDIFDISPTIQSFGGLSTRPVSVIEHAKGALIDVEAVSISINKNPFEGYDGRRYRGNTDLVFEELAYELGIDKLDRVHIADNQWTKTTALWASMFIENRNVILGKISYDVSDLSSAQAYWQKAVDEAEGSDAEFTLSLNLAPALIEDGKLQEARKHLEKALSLSEAVSDASDLAHLHTNMGELQIYENCYGDALNSLKTAEKLLQQIPDYADKALMARILANMGEAYFGIGEIKGAHQALEVARTAAHSVGDLYSQAIVLRGRARLADITRRYDDAVSRAQHARQLWQQLGMGFFEVATMIDIGGYQRHAGKVDQAIKTENEVIERATKNGWLVLEAVARGNLAVDLTELGKFTEAVPEFQFAVENTKGLLAITYQINYGLLLIRMDRHWDGIELLNAAIKTLRHESTYSQRNELRRALLNLSLAYLESNCEFDGVKAARESCEIARELGDVPGEIRARVNVGLGLINIERGKEGIAELEEVLSMAQVHLGSDSHEATHIQELIAANKPQGKAFAYYIEPCQLCLGRGQYESCGWCTDVDSAAGNGRVKLPDEDWGYPYHRRAHSERQYFSADGIHIPELDGKNPPY